MTRGISIILCTHNGAAYLHQQLDSLIGQSSQVQEIIISDDASSDRTRAIIAEFAKAHPDITKVVLNNPALGFADNFLAACDHATQEWIAFCDQDDIWHPDKIATCRAAMADGVTLIAHRARLIDAQGQPIGDFDQGILAHRRAPPLSYDLWGTFWGFSVLFRRDLLNLCNRQNRFEDYIYANGRKIAHDRWVCFLAQMTGICVELPDRLADYRQHDANVAGAGQGANVHATLAKDAIGENATYLPITRHMWQIVADFPADAATRFPLFDRARTLHFIDQGIAQLTARQAVYQRSGIQGLLMLLWQVRAGRYRHIATGKMRWRSAARDFFTCLQARRKLNADTYPHAAYAKGGEALPCRDGLRPPVIP